MALYRLPDSVLYCRGGGGALYGVPCSRFYTIRDDSLTSPVFGLIYQMGGRLSTVPCVKFYIAGGRGKLSTVHCLRF